MPRTSRTVAQRLATQGKSRRRRTTRVGEPLPPAVEQILDEVAPEPADAAPAEPTAGVQAGRTLPLPAGARAASARRRPADAAAEDYGYVWADLRRIALVAGGLLLLLIVLSLFIR